MSNMEWRKEKLLDHFCYFRSYERFSELIKHFQKEEFRNFHHHVDLFLN